MKVFISHKDADSLQALLLKIAFEKEGVSAYLDVLEAVLMEAESLLQSILKHSLISVQI